MTDLEMTKKCAEAMGYRVDADGGFARLQQGAGMDEPDWFEFIYDPLHDDAQAMALVKEIELNLGPAVDGNPATDGWDVTDYAGNNLVFHRMLNRAIVECVAKMQETK